MESYLQRRRRRLFIHNIDIISLFTRLVAWGIIFYLAFRIHKKQAVKAKLWKIVVVLFVGLISLSFSLNMFDTLVSISILPLGVWGLYVIFRRKKEKWLVYRPYAWLGFWANFLFLASILLSLPFDHLIYPKDKLTTHISNVENAYLINIHPSAKERSLQKESLLKQLSTMNQERIFNDQWYESVYTTEPNERYERFPYLLVGSLTKWGSGLETMIFLEDDGKGILVVTSEKQLYFRSTDSFIEEGKASD